MFALFWPVFGFVSFHYPNIFVFHILSTDNFRLYTSCCCLLFMFLFLFSLSNRCQEDDLSFSPFRWKIVFFSPSLPLFFASLFSIGKCIFDVNHSCKTWLLFFFSLVLPLRRCFGCI